MELVTMSYAADGVIGLLSVVGYLFVLGLVTMWLSSFYILSTWWDSHRITSHHSTSSSGSNNSNSTANSQAARQLKKINSFITPVTTTDILLN